MDNVHMEFIEQARLQGLLDGACPMKAYIFLARELPGFLNCALDAISDEVIVRLALFHWCSCLRLQDNHRPVGSRAIWKDPPILTVNHIETSAPHDHRAGLVERIACDFIETIPCAGKPGEDF